MILCLIVCMLVSFLLKDTSDEDNIYFSDEPFVSLTSIRTTYVQCLELISYGMARLCLVTPQVNRHSAITR